MNVFDSMHISASGLTAQRTRVNIASSNLANAESTRGPDGQPYKRKDPVFEAVAGEDGGAGVRVAEIQEDEGPGKRVYMPGHPDATEDGFVTLPNVDPVHEVVNLMSAQRGYEANAAALDAAKSIADRALDLIS